MPTTSIHPGCRFCQTCTYGHWGDVTEDAAKTLGKALVNKFNTLARAQIGDHSISWQPYTSEIFYECMGQTTADHLWSDPKTPWVTGDDEVDWEAILTEAEEWLAEHMEEILRA